MKYSKKITLGLLILALVSFLQLGLLLHGHLSQLVNDPCLKIRIINLIKTEKLQALPFSIYIIK